MCSLIYIFPVVAFDGYIAKLCIAVIRIVTFVHYLMDFWEIFDHEGNVIGHCMWTCIANDSVNKRYYDNGFVENKLFNGSDHHGLEESAVNKRDKIYTTQEILNKESK